MALRTQGGRFIDETGRTVLLRGVNVSGRHKSPPFEVVGRPEDLRWVAQAGFNVIRWVVPWEALEPNPGSHDLAYLDRMAERAEWAGRLGIHVIFDVHQDLFSRVLGGSGAPVWALQREDRDVAYAPDRNWFLRYATDERVRRSLRRFWTNEDGIQDRFLECLRVSARRLKGVEAFVGFEPFNEPFPGDLEAAEFETELLEPFYRKAISAVRSEAPNWLCFVEGVLMGSESGTRLQLGGLEGVVYFPHFYDKMVHLTCSYDQKSRELERVLATYAKDAERMGVPWLLGEFGVPSSVDRAVAYLEDHLEAFDRHQTGGCAWHFDPSGEDWNEEGMSLLSPSGEPTERLLALARPFPRALAGSGSEMRFDLETRTYSLRYVASGLETEIVVPRLFSMTPSFEVQGGSGQWEEGLIRISASEGSRVEVRVEGRR